MLETITLWLIIAAAAIYSGRNIYRTLSGRTKGCGCDCGEERTSPPLQQELPSLKDKKDKPEK